MHPLQCHLQVSDAESVQCLHFHHRPVPVNLCPLLVCKFLGPGTFLHLWASYSGILAPTNECLHELHFQLGHGLKDWSMQALAKKPRVSMALSSYAWFCVGFFIENASVAPGRISKPQTAIKSRVTEVSRSSKRCLQRAQHPFCKLKTLHLNCSQGHTIRIKGSR